MPRKTPTRPRRVARKLRSRDKAPEVLYHYTTAAALVGIISGKRLRATNFLSHNDHSELTYGLDFATEQLQATLKRGAHPKPVRRSLSRLTDQLLHLRLEQIGAYYASFSEVGNLLSQWRTYSGTQGFALGFRPYSHGTALSFRTEADEELSLCRVLYDEDEQARTLAQLIASFERGCEDPQFFETALSKLITTASAMKHAGFAEEREWRIMYHPAQMEAADANHFRVLADGSDLVSYIELLPIEGVLPIASVVCGPGVYVAAAQQSLKLLLRQSGYKDVQIKISDIPAL
ncbi:MAG TPA: DUF2971 domain-containing protein [Terriglobales bacterium]|jgi:hypothetical protein